MSLADRGAIVTGGSRGIGAEIARCLAELGVRVIVAARSTDEIERVAAALRRGGAEARAIPCDVAEPESIEALFSAARSHLGDIDILINNAGIASAAPVAKLELAEWTRLWTVNATGTFLTMKQALPGMVERGWGRIVNMASIAALRGARYISGYAASKHAVMGLTRSAAAEVAAHGVTVNAVCPGYVDTPMTDTTISNIVERTGLSEEEALDAILTTSPLGRLITPEEVAAAAVFLCAEEAAAINGQTIVLDGGAITTH